MKFLLSRQAERALQQQWDYYFDRNGTRLADRILAEIFDEIGRLIELPELGHFRPDLTDRPFRFYLVYNIFLIYDPKSSPLYIARAAQDIKTRMEKDED